MSLNSEPHTQIFYCNNIVIWTILAFYSAYNTICFMFWMRNGRVWCSYAAISVMQMSSCSRFRLICWFSQYPNSVFMYLFKTLTFAIDKLMFWKCFAKWRHQIFLIYCKIEKKKKILQIRVFPCVLCLILKGFGNTHKISTCRNK